MTANHHRWRVGKHYDIHIYDDRNVPVATAMTPEWAQQIVQEHNAICDLATCVQSYPKPEQKEKSAT